MKNFLILPFLLLASFASVANAQMLGCPYKLLWSDGQTFAYNAGLCAGGLGGTCTITPTFDILYFGKTVETGCATSGTPAMCICKNAVPPINGGGGGLFTVTTNGTKFKPNAATSVGDIEHYVAKGDKQIGGKDTWFRIIKGTFKTPSGESMLTMSCFMIDQDKPPVKPDGTTTSVTEADEFKELHAVTVTLSSDGKTPVTVDIQKTEDGGIDRFKVITK